MTILLHGFTGSAHSWDGIPGRAIDLYGHRRERAAPPYPSFEETIAALAAELTPLAPAALAGYSLGARVALALLASHPDLFTSATLIGVSPGLESEDARAARRVQDEAWAKQLEVEGVEAFADAWEQQPGLRVASPVPAERLAAWKRVRRSHTAVGLAWCLRTLGVGSMPDYWSRLRSIERPVRLVVGGEDEKFRAISERMLQLLPDAEVVVVPGAGHNLLLERPGELGL